MAVNLTIPPIDQILHVPGVELGVAQAGIKKANHTDTTVFVFAEGSEVAGVFTTNRFKAAPVQICEKHLNEDRQPIRALVINSGNANAGTGKSGLQHSLQTCEALAKILNIEPTQVLPFSTGVILEPLPVDKLINALPHAVSNLDSNHWFNAANAIMTTDTLPKIVSKSVTLGEHTVHITGISKGAGMIRPNMATMLGFLATDLGFERTLLRQLCSEVANHSFNRITVDGDTSTNDSFIIAATGRSGLMIDSIDHPLYQQAKQALIDSAKELAQLIVRDAEGATKFITITVTSAQTPSEALQVAYSIAHSPLVKTAFFASDPNLGRIICAVGYAGIQDLDVGNVSLWLDDVAVVEHGERHPNYLEEEGQRVMQHAEICVKVDLGRGKASETVYTCDFSHEYVSINADYRS